MFLGDFYFSEIAGNTFDEDMWDYIYSDMIPVAKTQSHTTRYTEKYNPQYCDYRIDDGYFIVCNSRTLSGRIVAPRRNAYKYRYGKRTCQRIGN